MASSIPSMEFASSSSKLPWMYDVLINFTGDDIRNKFVSHLDSALSNVGFTTFLHHQNAVKPMHIQQPIHDLCRVAIVVFTKTYSQSAWCLHQLQQIIEWHETYCRHVLPVYYEISPSDIRLQKGDFGKAFEATAHQTFSRQQLEHGMSRWSQALTKAANFFGWDESNYSFFVGKDRAYVREILNGCGVDADSGIRVLIDRNLIKLKRNNTFGMHPLLQEMGREIDHRKGEERYALEETDVFASERVSVLARRRKKLFLTRALCFKPYAPVIRHNSRLLKIVGNPEYLRLNSSKFLPNDFYLHGAISIDLSHTSLRLDWKKLQVWASLKVLNLSLKSCSKLRKVHRSIGCLYDLTLLNLKDCTRLSNLPKETYKLKSLRTLILSGCSKIELMEKDVLQMESLVSLIAENTAVKQVPLSIVRSKSIGYISLHRFEGLPRNLFPSIIRSRISPTMDSLSYVHSFMDKKDYIQDAIASFLRMLVNLRSVSVECDPEFELSKEVKTVLVEYCPNITESRISKHHLRSSFISVGRYNDFLNTVLAISESCDVSLPGDNDPYWLAHTDGSLSSAANL
ncbi:disease resistance protein RPS4B-like isoform X3 [Vigna unguiculata]|uniref:disease resistance protein RPS4B-like isoform X3 n=1 Tax=Vigna unguiculata TaxID=3917 RepID=UPI001015FE82|nr:disease resistance protein RPS4B-like isoform X3 [Vigna unguiculata]